MRNKYFCFFLFIAVLLAIVSGLSLTTYGSSSLAVRLMSFLNGDFTNEGNGRLTEQSSIKPVGLMNTKPVAKAGTDQSIMVNDTVTLDGSGSTDEDKDPLTFMWTITSVPEDSKSVIANPKAAITSFVADKPGTYIVQLVVNDGSVNSDPSTTKIQAEEPKEEAIELLKEAVNIIKNASPKAFRTPEMQKELLNKYDTVIENTKEENYLCALGQLENDILPKINGCIICKTPDENDWIIDCNIQRPVYNLTEEATAIIKSLSPSCCVTGNVKLCNPPAPGTNCTLVSGGTVYFYNSSRTTILYQITIQSDGTYVCSPLCGTYDIKAVESGGKYSWTNDKSITGCWQPVNLKIYR